jgi:hypothetical protein
MISANSNYIAAAANLDVEPIYLLEISGYSRKFTNQPTGVSGQYDWMIDISDSGTTINDLDGAADLGEVDITIQDLGHAITADFAGITLEGRKATLKIGYPGLAQSDFLIVHTGVIDNIASANKNNDYVFAITDKTTSLQKTIYSIGDDGVNPTDNKNPKTLNGHPLDILLDILENEIGYSVGDINVTKITDYRDSIFSGVQFKFVITSPPTAADFIANQIMKPLGGYYWNDNNDQFNVNFFYPLTTVASVFSLNEDNMLDIPEAAQADLINSINFRFDKDDDNSGNGDFKSESVNNYADSITKYGFYASHIVESDGMRAGLQGFLIAAIVSRMLFYRYGLKTLAFGKGNSATPVEARWTAARLQPGDIVDVTNSHIPDRVAGVMGITGKFFEVLDVVRDYSTSTVKLTLLDASYLSKFGTYLITPNAEANYTSASTADKAKYMFMCNDSDQYSNGHAANVLG